MSNRTYFLQYISQSINCLYMPLHSLHLCFLISMCFQKKKVQFQRAESPKPKRKYKNTSRCAIHNGSRPVRWKWEKEGVGVRGGYIHIYIYEYV